MSRFQGSLHSGNNSLILLVSREVPNILKRDFKASDVEEDDLWVCKGKKFYHKSSICLIE
ncbi:hypothetical protein FC699_35845 [Bacillus wiedmannii]|uniref:Uncharacterized protein n=1 Tax=Bacillus wiedmannii TaxID=1890302 RepID=A0A4U2MTR5_9BACI|nr:hypothetical protein FC694_16365 [Bacillus wiedmannii]TKI79568.1 hypothetical protein FC699_35845 [Bacillus wiedmannii]